METFVIVHSSKVTEVIEGDKMFIRMNLLPFVY